MDRDNKTRTGARVPGVERQSARTEGLISASSRTQSREQRRQPRGRRTPATHFPRRASSAIAAVKPYWGKLTVRNFRGGNGNVGIIRSPVRTIALPDTRSKVVRTGCLRFRWKAASCSRRAAFFDGDGLVTAQQESDESKDRQEKGWHVLQLFGPIHSESICYERTQ